LLIVTNDGSLANRLTHPRYQVAKTYLVKVAGEPPRGQLKQLEQGIRLAEGWAQAESVKFKRKVKGGSEIELTLTEGRNREIRRLLARVGHKVLRLKRIAIGSYRLGNLPSGAYRELSPADLEKLQRPFSEQSIKKDSSTRTGSRRQAHSQQQASKTTRRQGKRPGQTTKR